MLLPPGCDAPSTTTRVATMAGGGRSDDAKKIEYSPDSPVIVNDQLLSTGDAIDRPGVGCLSRTGRRGGHSQPNRCREDPCGFDDDTTPERRTGRSRERQAEFVVSHFQPLVDKLATFLARLRQVRLDRQFIQAGRLRRYSNAPFAPTVATRAPFPKPPKLRNNTTSKPSADRPDSVATEPLTRTGVAGTSSMVTFALISEANTGVARDSSLLEG